MITKWYWQPSAERWVFYYRPAANGYMFRTEFGEDVVLSIEEVQELSE